MLFQSSWMGFILDVLNVANNQQQFSWVPKLTSTLLLQRYWTVQKDAIIKFICLLWSWWCKEKWVSSSFNAFSLSYIMSDRGDKLILSALLPQKYTLKCYLFDILNANLWQHLSLSWMHTMQCHDLITWLVMAAKNNYQLIGQDLETHLFI